MDKLNSLIEWLKSEDRRKVLAFIGAGIVGAVGIYATLSSGDPTATKISVGGDNKGVIVEGDAGTINFNSPNDADGKAKQ